MRPKSTTKGVQSVASSPRQQPLPARTCIGCRQGRAKAQLIRVVRDPTGRLIVDPQGKLPGRGAYICPQRACAAQALKGTRLREAFRQEVTACAVEELVRTMANTLAERAMACLHIARKAGRVVSGYRQVMRALVHEPVALLLVAEDTAPERRREYERRCARRQIPYRSFLTKARLGELVGRDESSAMGIEDARLSERLTLYLEGMRRLMER
jgi:predicted RNA-binding protein YlxR (DUF448 family)/ribosomal protein L30E